MVESGLRVLVIDADAADRERVSSLVAAGGYTAMSAGDSAGALARAEKFRPDLVLLDPLVPGTRGFDIIRRLKQLPASRRSQIVLLTRLIRPISLQRWLEEVG